MRRVQAFLKSLVIPGSLGIAVLCNTARPAEDEKVEKSKDKGEILQVQQVPTTPQQPTTPTQPIPSTPSPSAAPAPSGVGQSANLFGSAGGTPGAGGAGTAGGAAPAGSPQASPQAGPSTTIPSAAATPAASALSGAQALPRASSDLGDLLGKSPSATGVEVQRRNPVVSDPRVRGYHVGQLFTTAEGAFYLPGRQDLDTIVSKLDSNLIRNVVVVKGPYSVRYGPGFAFIDVETLGSPRYENGFEAHGASSLLFKTNGDQWRGRQAFWGGDYDWGFRVGYDLGAGNDYRNGSGDRINASYNNQNIDFAFGFNLTPDARFEFHILRQDQHNVEFPGQLFDINRSITDAYTARFTLENQEYFDRWTVDAWYNASRFNGDNLSASKQAQIASVLPAPFQGVTDANIQSPGYRTAFTWGKDNEAQLTIGSDMRYVTQRLNEFDTFANITASFPIPRSSWTDPGFFADTILPLGDKLSLKAGARFDFVDTEVDPGHRQIVGIEGITPPTFTDSRSRSFDLWAAYLTGDYKVTRNWTASFGYGHALRAPTLTELYAKGPFLGIVQNGLNSVQGNENLAPEELRQMDLSVRAEYDRARFGLSGFYSWIHNYITLEVLGETTSTDPRTYRFVNTDQVTMAGFEMYAEWDTTEWLTPFATMSYVEGRDHTRDLRGTFVRQNIRFGRLPGTFEPQEPLPGIPPYEGRVGVRIHERGKSPRWGVEFLSRMVASQERVATSLNERTTPGFTIFNVRSYWQVTQNLLLTGGVENLTDETYREHLDLRTFNNIYQPGVNFYLGAQLTY